jgi:hypothetical protein
MLLMSAMVALLASSVLLGFAQSEDSASSQKDHGHHNHYAEFAKVPEKARAKTNPLAKDPDAPIAGRKLFEQHCARNAMETQPKEGGRPRVYAPRKSNKRRPERCSGF